MLACSANVSPPSTRWPRTPSSRPRPRCDHAPSASTGLWSRGDIGAVGQGLSQGMLNVGESCRASVKQRQPRRPGFLIARHFTKQVGERLGSLTLLFHGCSVTTAEEENTGIRNVCKILRKIAPFDSRFTRKCSSKGRRMGRPVFLC